MPAIVDFHPKNPFRPPEWRLLRVLAILDRIGGPGRSSTKDDKWVRGFRAFLKRYREYDDARRAVLFNEDPDRYLAWLCYEKRDTDNEVPLMIEARTLARQPVEDIARETVTSPGAVTWYQKMLFDVENRLDSLDWVMKHVLVPAYRRSREPDGPPVEGEGDDDTTAQLEAMRRQPVAAPFYDGMLKFFAYFGGIYMLDFMLVGFQRGELAASRDDTMTWLERHITGNQTRRTASSVGVFEINRYNVVDLFNWHARMRELSVTEKGAGAQRSGVDRNVAGLIGDIQYAIGHQARESARRDGFKDDVPGEPRASELLAAAAGGKPPADEADLLHALPPPRRQGRDQHVPREEDDS